MARVQVENARFRADQTRLQTQSALQSAYMRWNGDQQILRLEEENMKLAEQSLFIATERERIGLGNYLETKQSQSSFQDALTRLVNARFNLKQSEMALRRISGTLTESAASGK